MNCWAEEILTIFPPPFPIRVGAFL